MSSRGRIQRKVYAKNSTFLVIVLRFGLRMCQSRRSKMTASPGFATMGS